MSPSLPSNTPTPTTTPAHGRKASTANARCTEIVFPGTLPGNNGKGGLIRMHWTKKKALSERLLWLVRFATKNRHTGPVRLELIRYSVGPPMDYDNLVSTGKIPTDAVVKAKVLPDDNPTIIAERSYTQLRAESKAAQRTLIRIIDLPAITGTQPQ